MKSCHNEYAWMSDSYKAWESIKLLIHVLRSLKLISHVTSFNAIGLAPGHCDVNRPDWISNIYKHKDSPHVYVDLVTARRQLKEIKETNP